MLQSLPIGNDQFEKIREKNAYYADKSLMIKDFIEFQDEVAIISRPKRFGKTLNITMMREFFDITRNSASLFEGLEIMQTAYKNSMNTLPVIFLSFKDCQGAKVDTLRKMVAREVLKEYERYSRIVSNVEAEDVYQEIFRRTLNQLKDGSILLDELAVSVEHLLHMVAEHYQMRPIVLIDEYDQPLLSSMEYGYYHEVKDFFNILYGSVLKGNRYLGQALLMGSGQAIKESLLLKLNNAQIYTMSENKYSAYFGLSQKESTDLLSYYGLSFSEEAKELYEDSLFLGVERYNPWAVLQYALKNRPVA